MRLVLRLTLAISCAATVTTLVACADDEPVHETYRCLDPCQSDERACAENGQVLDCVGPDARGCFAWSDPRRCGEHQACVEGACVCTAPCVAGNVTCGVSQGLVSCAGPDGDGCLFWGAEDAAPCACQNPCLAGETACGPGGGLMHCIDDGRACPTWSAEEPCPDHQLCLGGGCVCQNPCAAAQARCGPTGGQLECAAPDAVGCWSWAEELICSAWLSCDESLGRCRTLTPQTCASRNECYFVGQKICRSADRYRECQLGYDGCLTWDCSS